MPVDMVPRNVQSPNHQNTKRQEVCHPTLAHLRCSSSILVHLESSGGVLARLEGGVILARLEDGTILAHLESRITALAHPGSNLDIDPALAHSI